MTRQTITEETGAILNRMYESYDSLLKAFYAAQHEYYIASTSFNRGPDEERFQALQSSALTLMFSHQRMGRGQRLIDRANGKVFGELQSEDLSQLLEEIEGLCNG